jgi:hypothetical protein
MPCSIHQRFRIIPDARNLDKASALPILTVGEDEAFAQNGGIINFVLKNGNVRLEIDLAAAKKAGLTISSRLLAVADVVKGKAKLKHYALFPEQSHPSGASRC